MIESHSEFKNHDENNDRSDETSTDKTAERVSEASEVVKFITIPINKFLPLFGEIITIMQEIVDMYNTAETNKRICGVLLDRVQAAEAAVKNLKIREKERPEFFTEQNIVILRKLINVIRKIADYIKEIRELKGLWKYINCKSVAETFKVLTAEFDDYMSSLNFAITIELKLQGERDKVALSKDIQDTNQLVQQLAISINTNQDQLVDCIDNIEDNVTNIKENVYEIKECVKKMLKGFDDFHVLKKMIEVQAEGALKKEDIIEKPLNSYDFSRTEEERGKIRKWIRNSDDYEVAFTEMNSLPEDLYFEVSMLKRLQESRDIIQFFGIVENERLSKTYLVTEWPKYGSLEEYYRKEVLDNPLKLQIALDIVRGLNFLQAYKILHHDVRSANIMIDTHKHAKIANFGMSRRFADASKNLKNVVDASRYKAPEKIKNGDYEYDSRCEVFSFGILLWEIAETEIPFSNIETNLIECEILKTPISLIFKSNVPEKWKKLVFKATEHDPCKRPDFKSILFKLKSLSEDPDTSSNKNIPLIPASKKSYVRNIMSIEEAIKQHDLKDGNICKAWESFEFYSKLGDMTAKYYKGYYLLKNLMKFRDNKEDRLKRAANLFKEAADEGDMMKAQLRYANCLCKGTGVIKNSKLAHKYFSKAADKGSLEAIFNVGNMYYKGIGVNKNVKE
ncbi:13144_t:CDS:2, partial [Gigaspora rosea]